MSTTTNHTIVSGIDCYGKAEIGANYEVKFDDEALDFIATDIEATTWVAVVNQLARKIGVRTSGIVEIEAC